MCNILAEAWSRSAWSAAVWPGGKFGTPNLSLFAIAHLTESRPPLMATSPKG